MAAASPGSSRTVVYNNVTVLTEEERYENVVAIHVEDSLGIVPDPDELKREYGPGAGPGPEKLLKGHARYVVPWRRVVRIDRGAPEGGRGRASGDPLLAGPDDDPDARTTGTDDDPDGRSTTGGEDPDATREGDGTGSTDEAAHESRGDEDEGDDDPPDNVFDDL